MKHALKSKEGPKTLAVTPADMQEECTIIALFEAAAECYGENVAVKIENKTLTYYQLNARANSLGKRLRKQGIGPNDIVAIVTSRTIDTIVGILGILKSGGAYLPIDPGNPAERINYILGNSEAKAVLAERSIQTIFDKKYLVVDIAEPDETAENLQPIAKPEDLAYVIYTSGTTGNPKGVLVENRNLYYLVKWQQKDAGIDQNSVVLQKSSLVFDVSVCEIFSALLAGAQLQLLTETENVDFDQMTAVLFENKVTHMFMVSTLFSAFIEYVRDHNCQELLAAMKKIYLGGDPVTADLLVRYREVFSEDLSILNNSYGPTECTVTATSFSFSEYSDGIISIGKPIDHAEVLIVSEGRICDVGEPGEMWIGGKGVSRGYLGNEALTNEKFADHPNVPGAKVYKTGDLVQWLPDGTIQFFERVDEQVKIRGYRIELGEIKARLCEFSGVRDAVVVAWEQDQSKYLCGYLIWDGEGGRPDPEVIKKQLSLHLPEYMIPAHLLFVDEIPVTANGKLDKHKLPLPVIKSGRVYAAPENQEQERLAAVFESVLGIKQVGIDDNFFEIGGDSIKAIRMISRIREVGFELSVSDIMSGKTVRHIAARMKRGDQQIIDNSEVCGSFPLTPIQKLFFDSRLDIPAHFNQSFLLQSREKLDQDILDQALAALCSQHDMLRAAYLGERQQVLPIQDSRPYEILCYPLDGAADPIEFIKQTGDVQQGLLKLEQGLLTKALLFQGRHNSFLLLIIHHLVVDGVSWRILIEDLNTAYLQARSRQIIRLPDKTLSFGEWCLNLEQYGKSNILKRELSYWKNNVDQIKKSHFSDQEIAGNDSLHYEKIRFSSEFTKQLLYQVNMAYHTEINDILLTALYRSIGHITDSDTVAIQLEGHGREPIHKKLHIDRTVGWFTIMYPVVAAGIGKSLKQDIRNVKEMLRKVPNHGIGYGVLAMDHPELKQDTADITFNYLGVFNQENDTNLLSIHTVEFGQQVAWSNRFGTKVNMDSSILDGSLQMTISYDSKYFSDQIIKQLKLEYERQLIQIVEHCVNFGTTQHTASDYGEFVWTDKEYLVLEDWSRKAGLTVEKIRPLTSMQEGMLYHKILSEQSSAYVVQSEMAVLGADPELLRSSIQELANKHEVLRSNIIYRNVQVARQVIYTRKEVEFHVIDIRNQPDREAYYETIKTTDVTRGFDLEQDSLMRITVVKITPEDTRMLMSFHHIMMDGWCLAILLSDITEIYGKYAAGKIVHRDYSQLQQSYDQYMKWVTERDPAAASAYWSSVLEGFEGPSEIRPEGYADWAGQEVSTVQLELEKEFFQLLQELSQIHGVTVNTILEAAWSILLAKYNNATDVVFGKVVSGRNINISQIENLVGLFINTIPVRANFSYQDTIHDFLERIQQQAIAGSRYDDLALPQIQQAAHAGSSLFETLVVFENFIQTEEDHRNLRFEHLSSREQTNYAITLGVRQGESLLFTLSYDCSKYDQTEAKRILCRLHTILMNMVKSGNSRIGAIEYLNSSAREQVMHQFNDTLWDNSNHKTFIQLFEETTSRFAFRPALQMGGQCITYCELNQKANAIAKVLLQKGVRANTIVPLVSERSFEMMVCIYGILKAGAAYLPIDPANPVERIRYIIADSGAEIIITDLHNRPHFINEALEVLTFDISAEEQQNPECYARPEDLAYVIYTSGTTGKPKGAMVENRNMINTIQWQINDGAMNENSVVLQKSPYVFDVSVCEIFSCGLAGGTLQLISTEENSDFESLIRVIGQNKVTHIFMVSTLAAAFMDYALENCRTECLQSLKKIYLGGDAVKAELLKKVRAVFGGSLEVLNNSYGPTECAVTATSFDFSEYREDQLITIGKPIPNVSLYVLQQERLCGIGIPGELCIGGAGVSRGYWNQQELTAEKFVTLPWNDGRIYRTGDQARWTRTGEIEFLGRIDEQVKIRGLRIELGEIEKSLEKVAAVQNVAVIVTAVYGEDHICAYLVSNEALDFDRIKEEIRSDIPDYMIPSYFIQMEQLPVTKNGKLDKRLLPKPAAQIKAAYMAPVTDTENMLCQIFETIFEVQPIGIHDGFQQLGGHSLKAVRLISQIKKELEVSLTLKEVMQAQTVYQIAELIKGKTAIAYKPIEKSNGLEISSAQKRLFAVNQLQESNITYNVPVLLEAKGQIDVQQLEQALQQLCVRHDVLRTGFSYSDGEFKIKIAEQVNARLECFEGTQEALTEHIHQFIRPFDLSQAPLMRANLYRCGETKSVLMLDFHHIIFDGGSIRPLLNDLQWLYEGRELPELQLQYQDYSYWQNRRNLKDQQSYWADMFRDGVPKLELPEDYPRPVIRTFQGDTLEFTAEKELKQLIAELTGEMNITEYTVLLSAFMILLSRYGRQEEIVIGTPVAGRTHPDVQDMLGMFVNTLAIKGIVDQESSFRELLEKLNERCLEAFENQDYPFEKLTEMLNAGGDTSRNPIFDVMFAFQNIEKPRLRLGNADLQEMTVREKIAKFDITLNIDDMADSYRLAWEYNTAIYKRGTIEWMGSHYLELLGNLLRNQNEPIKNIEEIGMLELDRLLGEFNDSAVSYPADATVVELFEKHLQKTPDSVCVIYSNVSTLQMADGNATKQFTYREIDSYANKIAHKLLKAGVNPGEFVGILAEKSTVIIPAMLGILKVGAAYLPLDPKNPDSRQNFIIRDSHCKLVLAAGDKRLEHLCAPVLLLNDSNLNGESDSNPVISGSADDRAYLMYTSGTTGNPKGVMISHKNIIRLVKNTNYINLKEIRILLTGSLTFDACTFEIWGPLLNGGTVVMAESEVLSDPELLYQSIDRHRINSMFLTTALFNQLISIKPDVFDGLTQLLVGGEKMSAHHAQMLRRHNKQLSFSNIYGPTESTTYALFYSIGDEVPVPVPIGKPISNTTAYVMEGNRLCGIGIPGELCLGGDGIAAGYLNQPELTKQKFIENPFCTGGVLYRTGDLVKWDINGDICYIGRIDEQVKIRGFRIELEEISNKIKEIPGIVEAAVTVNEINGDHYLCGYIAGGEGITDKEVKTRLAQSFPDYMIPSSIMFMDHLPLNKNGKIDKRKLPAMEMMITAEYIEPQTSEQCLVSLILAEVLGIQRVGIYDNFFELGGDSIKAIRMVSRLREHGYCITVKEIMQHRTVEKISAVLTKAESDRQADNRPVQGLVNMTPIQKKFFGYQLKNPEHFNQSVLLECDFILEVAAFKKAMEQLIFHHDMLRSRFENSVQTIKAPETSPQYSFAKFDISAIDDSENKFNYINKISDQLQGQMDFAQGILVKTAAFQDEGKTYLLIAIHHLVVDGVSWRILLEDLNRGYQAAINDQAIVLPAKTMSYQQWGHALKVYSESTRLQHQIGYWQEIDRAVGESWHLPAWEGQQQGLCSKQVRLSHELTDSLLKECAKAYHTQINDLLLTALARAVYEISGCSTISVNMEGHGRENIDDDIQIDRTVGWFTSIYPHVVSEIGRTLPEDICNVKESLRRIPDNGIGYGVIEAYRSEVSGQTPDITFNYLGEVSEHGGFEQMMRISSIPHGREIAEENHFGTPITINGSVNNGMLDMTISYDLSRVPDATFRDAFRAGFEKQLIEIIRHCKHQQERYTASDFGELEWSDPEFRLVERRLAEQNCRIRSIFPLTPMQEGMLYHKQLNETSTSYVIQSSYRIAVQDTPGLINQCVDMLAEKHPILKTAIIHDGVKEPRQVLLEDRKIEFASIDWTADPKAEEHYKQYKIQDVKRGFDLEHDSLIRFTVVKIAPDDMRMMMSFHHIIMDGWCLSILMNDLEAIYQKLADGDLAERFVAENKARISYETYTRQLAMKDKREGLEYWNELLEGYDKPVGIKAENVDGQFQESVVILEMAMTEAESRKVYELGRKHSVTINTVIETAWGVLLQKMNAANDVVFGKVVSGRDAQLEGIEEMVGLFINTVPVRFRDSGQRVSEALSQMQLQALQSGQYDDCSLGDIQAQSGLGSQLIQTLLVFENYYVRKAATDRQLIVEMEWAREETNYDINISVDCSDTLSFKMMYHPKKYRQETIQVLLQRLRTILKQISESPDLTVNQIELIAADEKQRIITEFNNTATNYPENNTIIELFESQAELYPDRIAVGTAGTALTYAQLNKKANVIARQLRSLGVRPDDFVGIIAEKEAAFVFGVIGILKAGGAYLPINPIDPENRVQFLVEDSKCRAVLVFDDQYDYLKSQVTLINLNEVAEAASLPGNLPYVNRPEDLAYMIYTSGTTGNPKGVMIEQRSVIRLVRNTNYLSFQDAHIMQTGSLTFDAATFELWGALLNGGTVYLCDNEIITNSESMEQALKEYGIDTMFITTALFNQLIDMNPAVFNQLTRLLVGGEKASEDHIKRMRLHNPKTCFMNVYGPTESTTFATFYRLEDEVPELIPIGRPISNTTAYILQGQSLCGIGMPGELCLGGDGIARGYLNQQELTKEKFIQNPLNPAEILYRTGDLARWREDGNIDYLGRIDEEVKIRGFRIQPDEIASHIRAVKDVKDAAVVVRQIAGEQVICAYLASNEPISTEGLKRTLKEYLPAYMIPSFFIYLDQLPMNKNGKIDKKALPEPVVEKKAYTAPETRAEMELAAIFEAVLGVDKVGADDSFFELGGHSLTVTRLVSQIEKILQVKLSFKEIMSGSTVRELARLVEMAERKDCYVPIEITAEEEEV